MIICIVHILNLVFTIPTLTIQFIVYTFNICSRINVSNRKPIFDRVQNFLKR